jgi:hypothetical protein
MSGIKWVSDDTLIVEECDFAIGQPIRIGKVSTEEDTMVMLTVKGFRNKSSEEVEMYLMVPILEMGLLCCEILATVTPLCEKIAKDSREGTDVVARRSWDPKNPEKVSNEDIQNMTGQQRATWELDRYFAAHGSPRPRNDGDDTTEED